MLPIGTNEGSNYLNQDSSHSKKKEFICYMTLHMRCMRVFCASFCFDLCYGEMGVCALIGLPIYTGFIRLNKNQ